MKLTAASMIVALQLWILSPLCCCWLESAPAASAASECGCAAERNSDRAPAERDSDCRCNANKIELPTRAGPTSEGLAQQFATHVEWLRLPEILTDRAAAHRATHFHDLPPPDHAQRLSLLSRFLL